MDWSPAASGAPGLAALALAGAAAAGGYLTKWLNGSGAFAAVGVGAAILAWGGWAAGAALATFFIVGSGLPLLLASGAKIDGDAKGNRRDASQVLANGGAAAIGAMLFRHEPGLALWAATSGLAAAAADTWATAVGTTSREAPRRLLAGAPVPPGTNGGMTWRGCAGAIGGGFSVAFVGAAASGTWALVAWATPIGVAGMVLDSLLGATLQARRWCDRCSVASDWRVHRCGHPTRHTGGLSWLDNDAVNLVATGAAVVAGAVGWRLAGNP